MSKEVKSHTSAVKFKIVSGKQKGKILKHFEIVAHKQKGVKGSGGGGGGWGGLGGGFFFSPAATSIYK